MGQQKRQPVTIIRRRQVEEGNGFTKSTLYLRIQQGLMTTPVSIGPRAVGWPDNEVQILIAARIAGKSDDQIREIVRDLEAARADAYSQIMPNASSSKDGPLTPKNDGSVTKLKPGMGPTMKVRP